MPDTDAAIAACSFCGKPNTEVMTLVAGPGVFICNECVDLSATIVAGTADLTREARSELRSAVVEGPVEDSLAMISSLVLAVDRGESELARWVSQAHAKGAAWDQIAEAIGIPEATARSRYGSR